MTPLRLFRFVAVAEAFTWAALLLGMFFKYVVVQDEIGVKVAGPVHGVAFLAFCLVTLLVSVDQRWGTKRTLLGLASAIPPFATVPFDRWAERKHLLHGHWHSRSDSESRAQRAVAWLLTNPLPAAGGFLVALACLTGVALVAGPPVG